MYSLRDMKRTTKHGKGPPKGVGTLLEGWWSLLRPFYNGPWSYSLLMDLYTSLMVHSLLQFLRLLYTSIRD